MSASERKLWEKAAHESRVEHFYGVGAERFEEYHDGYLNFGLWDEGIEDFVPAAENLVRHVGELAELDAESRLLDVACGMGTQDVYFLRHFAPAHIDALDVTWKHIEQGRRRTSAAGFGEDRVKFHHGTATALPFPAETFTHVIGIEGPAHFDTREKFMREAHRVLKPGGTIVMSDYTLKRRPRSLFDKAVIEGTRRIWNVPRENMDSVERYRAKMERAGFARRDRGGRRTRHPRLLLRAAPPRNHPRADTLARLPPRSPRRHHRHHALQHLPPRPARLHLRPREKAVGSRQRAEAVKARGLRRFISSLSLHRLWLPCLKSRRGLSLYLPSLSALSVLTACCPLPAAYCFRPVGLTPSQRSAASMPRKKRSLQSSGLSQPLVMQ